MDRKLAAGNWKMHGGSDELVEIRELLGMLDEVRAEVLVCPPFTLIDRMRALSGDSELVIGGQDCHWETKGAHTGDISAGMLHDAGASYAIVGHSERREDHGETDATVRAKADATIAAGLGAIVCVGETLGDRDAGKTLDVIGTQIAGSVPDDVTADNLVIAYEPVWAIGSGRTPSSDQIAEVHTAIRKGLKDRFDAETAASVRLLYGGSVKAGNAPEIFAIENVDGALVGGASLKASDFSAIIQALDAA